MSYKTRSASSAADGVATWLSRASATFCGTFLAILAAAVVIAVYVSWRVDKAIDNVDRQVQKSR